MSIHRHFHVFPKFFDPSIQFDCEEKEIVEPSLGHVAKHRHSLCNWTGFAIALCNEKGNCTYNTFPSPQRTKPYLIRFSAILNSSLSTYFIHLGMSWTEKKMKINFDRFIGISAEPWMLCVHGTCWTRDVIVTTKMIWLETRCRVTFIQLHWITRGWKCFMECDKRVWQSCVFFSSLFWNSTTKK